jgi:exonuclease SbcC
MIPLRLTLHNFMCYREGVPPLELARARLACLSGDNGAGKSALLDAITWSLWGRSRATSDLHLMSLGATEMRVEFEFRLGDRDYRVTRRRTRKGNATGWLDLHVCEPEAGAWRSLTGDGVRDTQRKIIDLLRMEYETFINSAFLLQGRADEFTVKPPAKRKEVLAEILGLSIYDDLEKRARERRRATGSQLEELDRRLSSLQALVEREPAEQALLTQLSLDLIAQDAAIDQLTARYHQAQQQLSELEQQERQLADLEAQIRQAGQLRQQFDSLADEARHQIARLEALIARRAEIEAGAEAHLAARQRRQALDAALRRRTHLIEQQHRVERAVDAARHRLQAELQTLTGRLADLQTSVGALPALEARYQELAQAAAEATRLAEAIAAAQAAERAAHGQVEALKARNDSLMAEMKRLKERQQQIDGAEAVCPLCRRPLGEHDKQHIHDGYQRDGLALKAEYQANQQQIEALLADSQRHREQITALEFRRRAAELQAREATAVATQIDQARQAAVEQAAVQIQAVEAARRLERGDDAPAERAELARLQAEIAALAYDEAAHDAARAAEQTTYAAYQERDELRRADEDLPRARARLTEHEAALAQLQTQIEQLQATADALAASVRGLPELRQVVQDLAHQLDAKRRERNEVERELGRVQERLAACQAARDELEAGAAERRRLAEERELYDELVEAFGKKGIQAMIIETVVPEVQDEANALLDRMPGNTMRVEFQTQRDSKSKDGDPIETLDVIIKDEAGARPYELYSGGEAFRANFAIRVALSKLLARRAGAQLQLLVIDEGFGTQDARGRESLVEAIRSIEADFATILVITHLTDIKDEFPTRIDVVKGLDGSLVTIR